MYVQQGSRRKVSGGSAAAPVPSRPADTELDKLSEPEVWLRLQRLMEVAKQKQGKSQLTGDTYKSNSSEHSSSSSQVHQS